MNIEGIVLTIITAATPLWLAALGELVTERSGVLNLGVEGMMAMGAVAGFAVAHLTGQPLLGVVAAILAGMATASLFALLTLVLVANQVASGLALTLFGLGLSALIGASFVAIPGQGIPTLADPDLVGVPVLGFVLAPFRALAEIPYVGRILFGQDPLVYAAVALTFGVWWFLFRTRGGLILRAVGDSHGSAHALGYNVVAVRFLAVLFGGACAGLAGGYLSLIYTPQWSTNMTAGRGWIALALVVFASWLPGRLAAGALLFGAVSIMQLHAQALGVSVPSQFLKMLPYVTTIVVLVLISRSDTLLRANTPRDLGRPFVPDR